MSGTVKLTEMIARLSRERDEAIAEISRIGAELGKCQAEVERLRELLKQALPHVEDAGDDTLAAIIDTQIGSQKW